MSVGNPDREFKLMFLFFVFPGFWKTPMHVYMCVHVSLHALTGAPINPHIPGVALDSSQYMNPSGSLTARRFNRINPTNLQIPFADFSRSRLKGLTWPGDSQRKSERFA